MHKWIIGYGWKADIDVIEAEDKDAALDVADQRSMQRGVPEEDLCDYSWAEPYSDELAFELGWIGEPTEKDHWRTQAPWR